MSASGKLSRQPEETWSSLHGRLSSLECKMDKVLVHEKVRNFVMDKATSLSCCAGYVLAGLVTTVLFLTGLTSNLVTPSGHVCKPNLFHLVCGPPSTGKSQAVKETALDPVNSVADEKDFISPVIQKTTSSGLTKKISSDHKGYIICTEIFDILFKLLKGDGDVSSGDSSLLCELFSGEQVSLNYGTQARRDIPQQMPFCIFGSIQVYPLAKIMALLDQGHGLLDRFLISVPLCLRPTPRMSQEARSRLEEKATSSFTDVMSNLYDLVTVAKDFCFSTEASEAVKGMEEDFILEINEAIRSGKTPPKSKKIDLIMRVALALHILTFALETILDGVDTGDIPLEIPLIHLEAAVYYISYCETQKAIFSQFITEVTSAAFDPPTFSPTISDIKAAIALFPGKLVSLRAFKASGPRSLRNTADEEFRKAAEELTLFGKVVKIRVPRAKQTTTIILKKIPDQIKDNEWTSNISKEAYVSQFNKTTHQKISANIRQKIIEQEDLPDNYFD
ncbi:hypothetical protein HOLleu_01090 [Holothuria leucospilota]|uniref:Uncharacterized protein n=1 Tax=Holothuria leucospilota TaxID=206669 RepID=A0A9Q1CNL1_HOLLE|nr:hypothetical protein HOLleu_05534 [Holothuria leucospilota]KAJ8048682.1 hypothetical protein HOLleu_01090 [Holothuria leucospilota]